MLGVHASPGQDDGPGLRPDLAETKWECLLAGCHADLVCVGHTHLPLDRTVSGIRVVNPGCVSNPIPPDLRAGYAVLEAGPSGYQVEHRQVDYDREAIVESLQRLRHPGATFIIQHLRGQYQPVWLKD